MRRAYLMIYSDATGGREVIKAWASGEQGVLHWRFDMPHCFYIVSELSAAELSASFIAANGKRGRFLISEVSDNRQGLLPGDTWYLLRQKKRKL